MRINGEWYLCDDGIIRPAILGELLKADGSWMKVPLLVDTGADRTVLSADVLNLLQLPHLPNPNQLAGVGGVAASVRVATEIRMTLDDGTKAIIRGQWSAFTDPAALDMSALGRDITDLFAVIVDRPGDTVCLVGQSHYYAIGRR